MTRAKSAVAVGIAITLGSTAPAFAGADVRLSGDAAALSGYVSNYTLATGRPAPDPTIAACSSARGRQNEPAVEIDPRDSDVIVGSSNDYCGVYNAQSATGTPLPVGPIYTGYYRSQDGGASFTSSLVPGYAGDATPFAARASIRTATAGDPVLAWDKHGRLFVGAEASEDPAGTQKGWGDQWVATFGNSGGATTKNDGKEFLRAVTVAKGSAAPGTGGKFHDKPMIAADVTSSACEGNIYYAWSRFTGVQSSSMYAARSTDHGVSFSNPLKLAPTAKNVQFADIAITGDGSVVITFNSFATKAGDPDSIIYVRSTDCGRTYSAPKTLVTYQGWSAQDIGAPVPTPVLAALDDPLFGEEPAAKGPSTTRDCGDFANACASGFTFFRADSESRSAANQGSPAGRDVYVLYGASRPNTSVATGTTYGTVTPGVATQQAIYAVRLNAATGQRGTPVLVSAQPRGQQLFPDVSVDGDGSLHAVWWDSRNDANGGDIRLPIGNAADRTVHPGLDAYAASSTDGGASWGSERRLSDVTTNPNYEQFDNRSVPFAGDYLWVSSALGRTFAVWTDWRDVVPGADPREGSPGDADGADVRQCRTLDAALGWSGDTCPAAGGLDQNIYGDRLP